MKEGEHTLKGDNKKLYEKSLMQNQKQHLHGTSSASIVQKPGRMYLSCSVEDAGLAEEALRHLTGITGWARAKAVEKDTNTVIAASVACAKEAIEKGFLHKTFKVDARRSDKSFPLNSPALCAAAGEKILEAFPELTVDVHHPEQTIRVEVREKAFVYGHEEKGLRGLPAGTGGRGLLLLSGGIDSPVAGFEMMRRGMKLEAMYFHAYPYTGNEAREKVERLANIVGAYAAAVPGKAGLPLHVINFTDVQIALRDRLLQMQASEWGTVMLRMAMMEAADLLARKRRLACIITGESLAQVASQTVHNIACTQSRLGLAPNHYPLPVLRPLIGTDKEDIITLSKKIGAYDTSIEPYPDCCTLFSPPHPVIHGRVEEANRIYEALELSELIYSSGAK
ncbi:MAG: tRNA 4-thiouridine(8) synthase ThiI [Spirochaetaceae bacterium]|nr:tRNA 4-thiouridine(8) synthase ThiI [Spirochaetaceae bacterium]